MEDFLDSAMMRQLLDGARAAAEQAYAPYSRFPVGAVALTADGTRYAGANIENASYGLTVCAERVAVWTAAAAGHRALLAVAVVAPQAAGTTPCGACRQVLNEFAPPHGDLIVICETPDGAPDAVPLAALLPRAFGGELREP